MEKVTARAHSNVAFIKYWGRKNEELRLPTNGSISMNLSNLFTTTTVEFSPGFTSDEIFLNGEKNELINNRIIQHLDRVRKLKGSSLMAKVVSQNNFPTSTGLSSSASGFAALTLASTKAIGLNLSERELSILARQGSGSACRSIPDGFVEWENGETSETSFAKTLFPAEYWDIVDIVAVVSKDKKDIATSEGQRRVDSSIFFKTRLQAIDNKIKLCKKYLEEKDFNSFGKLIEMEALELHAIMITSWPALLYWIPATITVMKAVQQWRREGLPVFFTINTGQDVHILCQKKDENELQKKIQGLGIATKIITNNSSKGTYLYDAHLF